MCNIMFVFEIWVSRCLLLVKNYLHSIHEISFCSEVKTIISTLFVWGTTFETNTTRYQCRMIWQDFHKAYQKHLGQQQVCKSKTVLYDFAKTVDLEWRLISTILFCCLEPQIELVCMIPYAKLTKFDWTTVQKYQCFV